MARIAGVDLPRGKRVDIALTYIYGIGRTTAMKILDSTGVNWERSIDDLSADEVNEIRKELELSWPASSSRLARAWPAHAYQCPHP